MLTNRHFIKERIIGILFPIHWDTYQIYKQDNYCISILYAINFQFILPWSGQVDF